MESKEDIVLSYPKLKGWIASRRDSEGARRRCLALLKEMASDFSPLRIGLCERILDTSLSLLYDGLNFQENGLDLRELVEGHSVVFVPNHQSHADYITLNYLIYKKYRFPVYIAGGINLNIFLLGGLFRGSGCFFIRRSFGNNVAYKLTLEAYLYYLLKSKRPVEFFFEGRRSRTGCLLAPQQGLYRLFLDAHTQLMGEERRDLLFIPVSINHEYVPEQRSLARELVGEKKRAESVWQLPGLVKLFARRFGTVHLSLGDPIRFVPDSSEDGKKQVRDLASRCFDAVCAASLVTPSSLISLILLDSPKRELSWASILKAARDMTDFCRCASIPLAPSLAPDGLESSLERAMDIMVGNKNITAEGLEGPNPPLYSIARGRRVELFYLKNTIFHHFLAPALAAHLIQGDPKEILQAKKARWKHEFCLPSTLDLEREALRIVSLWVGRELVELAHLDTLSPREKEHFCHKSALFCHTLRSGEEGLYCCALGLRILGKLCPGGFDRRMYGEKTRELFEAELIRGNLVRCEESHSSVSAHWALDYFEEQGQVLQRGGRFFGINASELDKFIRNQEKSLGEEES